MWSHRKTPSQPRSSARAARSARRRGSLSALNGARVSPRLASLVMALNVYLSGEIHTDWRERIERGAAEAGLDVEFGAPVTDHSASDNAGAAILGEQERPFWKDNLGAGVNAIRTRTLLERADVVVVRFGEQYRAVERRVRRGLRGGARQAARRPAPRGARPRAQGGRPRGAGRRPRARAGRRHPALRAARAAARGRYSDGDADRRSPARGRSRASGSASRRGVRGEHLLEDAAALDVGLELARPPAAAWRRRAARRRDRARASGRRPSPASSTGGAVTVFATVIVFG